MSLWYWSWCFDHTLQFFIRKWCWFTETNYLYNHYHSRPLRDQFPHLIIPTILWIETHQPWARFMIRQSLTTTMVQIVQLRKSTLLPDEDLQSAVETSQSISKWQSWDKQLNKLVSFTKKTAAKAWNWYLRWLWRDGTQISILEDSIRKNRTTISGVPLLPEIFCCNDLKSHVPFTFQLNFLEHFCKKPSREKSRSSWVLKNKHHHHHLKRACRRKKDVGEIDYRGVV